MKTVSNDYKNAIKNAGREIAVRIVYTQNNEQIVLSNSEINSANLHYEGNILKSVMKQLDLDSNIDIPTKTVLTYEFGVKVNNQYEYINFGNFIVKKNKKQENTNSYILTCYDYMLNSMIDYEILGITYPISVRNYLSAICTKLGITFESSSDNFVNYNQNITEEPFLDTNGNSIGYTFRDVLDELAKITASTICINNNNQLEVRYINTTNETLDESSLKNINVEFGEQYTVDVEFDDQILNYMDRQTVVTNTLNYLNEIQYYLNDFDSTGITYLELCDRYNVQIGNKTYSCIMLADEINVKRGLSENIHTEKPKDTTNEFNYVNDIDKAVRSATITLDQKIGEVDIRGKTINLTADNIAINSNNFSVTDEGVITATAGKIADYTIQDGRLYNEVYTEYNYTSSDRDRLRSILAGTITPTQEDYDKYDFNGDGILNTADLAIINQILVYGISTTTPLTIELASAQASSIDSAFKVRVGNNTLTNIGLRGINTNNITVNSITAGNIDCGTCTLDSTIVDVRVDFNKYFSTPPMVVITPITSASGVIAPKVRSVGNTHFYATIGGSGFSNIDCNWIAIGN